MGCIHLLAAFSALLSVAEAAVNLYPAESDFPAGVNSTTACGKALNASVDCLRCGSGKGAAGALLPVEKLNTVCVPACYTSVSALESQPSGILFLFIPSSNRTVLRSPRRAAPRSSSRDQTQRSQLHTWPTTFYTPTTPHASKTRKSPPILFSRLTTQHNTRTTGVWCNTVFNSSWPGTTTETPIETLDPSVLCSSCNIQSLVQTGQSVFGYDPTFASTVWPTIQSKCKITTPINDPGHAYINLTTPDPGPLTCQSGKTYTIKSGDTCQAIAESQNVGTNDLVSINSILPGCTSIQVGQVLCLPSACQTYKVKSGDTCQSIIAAQGAEVTLAQLLNWNPSLDPYCSNLVAGVNICVRTPGGAYSPVSSAASGIPTGTLITTATPAPTGTAPGAPTNCGRCQGITLSDFKAANPQINAGCTNLWAATAYCVYVVNKGTPPSSYAIAPSNIANGTTKNCYQYYTAVSGDTCTAISYSQVANLTDLYRWNAGLNSQCTNLAVGSAYCVWGDPVGTPTTTTSTGTPPPRATMPPLTPGPDDSEYTTATSAVPSTTSSQPTSTGVPRPTNAAPNSTSSCRKWYTVQSGDYCYLICQNQGCTVPDLQKWNPDLGTDCVAQLGVAYCVSA
ncbi:LysM domain protein [Rhizoctonia solani]|uniref:LysM domain protein n=1 Tax=Rhizoctonia solani TaxID=456999 RepID=A0A8H8P4X9_9AGAM|nr:LysM domain protein [Rhizoctonia solani]QRW23672.1 LysM domain protein [Rhizoctonia solani]